jgi:hypothetical protein
VTAYTHKRYGFLRQHLLDGNGYDPIEAITADVDFVGRVINGQQTTIQSERMQPN